MAAINFPSSPATGASFTAGGKTWRFNGTAWRLQPISSTPGISADGRVTAYADLAGLTPSAGLTYLVEGDGMFYIYDATLGWPSQGAGISIYGTNYGVGTSFPLSPSTDDRFYRTDLHMMAFYDGGRWLSEQEYEAGSGYYDRVGTSGNTTDSSITCRLPVRNDYPIFITRWVLYLRVFTTNNSTNYWNVSLAGQAADASSVSITGASAKTQTDPVNTLVRHDIQLNTLLNPLALGMFVFMSKVGAPGGVIPSSAVYYRLVLG